MRDLMYRVWIDLPVKRSLSAMHVFKIWRKCWKLDHEIWLI